MDEEPQAIHTGGDNFEKRRMQEELDGDRPDINDGSTAPMYELLKI